VKENSLKDSSIIIAFVSAYSTLLGYIIDISFLQYFGFQASSAEYFILNYATVSLLIMVTLPLIALCKLLEPRNIESVDQNLEPSKMNGSKFIFLMNSFLLITFSGITIKFFTTSTISDLLFLIGIASFYFLIIHRINKFENSLELKIALTALLILWIADFTSEKLAWFYVKYNTQQIVEFKNGSGNKQQFLLVKDYHDRFLIAGFDYAAQSVEEKRKPIILNGTRRIVPLSDTQDWVFHSEELEIIDSPSEKDVVPEPSKNESAGNNE